MYTILLVIHTILVIFLIMTVLIQRTDSDGLSGLSGGGGNQFMTGRATANLVTRTTAVLAGLFMLTSLILAIMASHMTARSIVDTVPADAAPITAPAATVPAAAPKPEAATKAASKASKEKHAKEAPAVPKPE